MSSTSTPTGSASPTPGQPGQDGLLGSDPRYFNTVMLHVSLVGLCFLLFLPIGVIIPRYLRTFTKAWFTSHWLWQAGICGPIFITGWALGVKATHINVNTVRDSGQKDGHFNDAHKILGLVLGLMYFAQLMYGAIIHYIKPRGGPRQLRWVGGCRPIQNYGHAIFGLTFIGLGFYQIHLGMSHEWANKAGRGHLPQGCFHGWLVIVCLWPFIYALGLLLLRRQFRQERAVKQVFEIITPPYSK